MCFIRQDPEGCPSQLCAETTQGEEGRHHFPFPSPVEVAVPVVVPPRGRSCFSACIGVVQLSPSSSWVMVLPSLFPLGGGAFLPLPFRVVVLSSLFPSGWWCFPPSRFSTALLSPPLSLSLFALGWCCFSPLPLWVGRPLGVASSLRLDDGGGAFLSTSFWVVVLSPSLPFSPLLLFFPSIIFIHGAAELPQKQR